MNLAAPPRRSILVVAAAAAALALALAGCGGGGEPSPSPSPGPAAELPPAPTFVPTGSTICDEQAYTAVDGSDSWRHPSQNFYAPEDDPPRKTDLDHLIVNDSAVVVQYARGASQAEREALRDWAATVVSVVVVPAADDAPFAVEAFTSNRHLLCDGVNPEQLTSFAQQRGVLQIPSHGDG